MFQLYKQFFNDANHGVVLFSLGYTGFSAKDIPKNVVHALVDAFSQLDQKVIMRFDPSAMPYIPKNVLVSNWIPQQDLLGINFCLNSYEKKNLCLISL